MSDQRVLVESDGTSRRSRSIARKNSTRSTPRCSTSLRAFALDLDRDKMFRVVILTGAGDRAFCVGADVNAWAALDPLDMWRRWVRDGHRVFDADRPPPPTGHRRDQRFRARRRIGTRPCRRSPHRSRRMLELAAPEVKIGTVPGWAGTDVYPR